jgi:protein-tyrosine phosphatase
MRDAPTPAAARAAFASFYRELPKQFRLQYRQMFDELLAGNAPLAFNCSAGKDRTGVAAALILTALGVPRERVMDDYLLSNKHYKPKPMSAAAADDPTARLFGRLPPDVIQVFMGVEPSYLDAAFSGMVDEFGSVDKYLEEGLDLDAADREKLRRLYTEPTH